MTVYEDNMNSYYLRKDFRKVVYASPKKNWKKQYIKNKTYGYSS